MGTTEIFLCFFLGHFITVQSRMIRQDDTFPQEFPGFLPPFPFKRNFDFTPYDTIFSSWQTRTPDFHMLADFPPIMHVPKIEVFCDESELILRVDKRSYGIMLTEEEIQLGDGCYSNRALPHQFVFTYSLDECGTTRVMQNGLAMFTNTLYLNLKKPPPTWWQTPSTVHISCTPKRSYADPNFFVSAAFSENGKPFNIKAMNSSWSSTAESNIYKRGQAVNLQVSAQTRPKQQLFIQSCFVSASPEPETAPRHAVILNKGCTAPLGSPHAVVRFVASNRADVVNLVLNTSYLISEMYIHCSVLLSDKGVTFGSKSCNYNMIQSRWEDLSGTAEVCKCCSSKCKGLSVNRLPEDVKAVVSTGPLVIVDKDVETSPEPSFSEPQETPSALVSDPIQFETSDGAATEDVIVSGTSISRSKLSSPPQGVVVVSQDPAGRLTLWLPGQVEDTENGENIGSESEDKLTVELQANYLPELQVSTADQESQNEIRDHNLNLLTLVDLIIPPQLEEASTAEDSQIKMWLGRVQLFDTEAPEEADVPLPDTTPEKVHFSKMRDELAQRQADAAVMLREEPNNARPIIRSKLQFSKGKGGLQTLSYEEEEVKQEEDEGVVRRFGMDGIKREPRQTGLRSTFLDLLRRMDKAE
ncbi:zona pellucida protein C [Pagrus major]|uniref:zona pellucida protein C n=1 Tax=Pagrus major TaxID=143350 RepID=UPI003CC8E1A0